LVQNLKIHPPTGEEFWEAYENTYRDFLANAERREPIRHRLLLAYRSLIAEHHAYCWFDWEKGRGVFDGAFNDMHYDLIHGIDFVVWRSKPRYLGIQVRYVGPRYKKFASVKPFRLERRKECGESHTIPLDSIECHLIEILESDPNHIDGIHLIDHTHVGKVIDHMTDLGLWD